MQFLGTWLLHPPAVQLWFLRDLMVLVLIAPLIRRICLSAFARAWLGVLLIAWALNWQCFPMVFGWRLLHLETLLFFALGCLAVSRRGWIETVGRAPTWTVAVVCVAWWALIAARIGVRADFDIWYSHDYGLPDLLLHQASILVGCFALFMIAWRIRYPWLIRLSGASFFVYLVHEFPLRAIVERCGESMLDRSLMCWVLTPLVLVGCFAWASLCARWLPTLTATLTGGRSHRVVGSPQADVPSAAPARAS
jgi:surface polysaccharide O-acyltransferase-like enzyme